MKIKENTSNKKLKFLEKFEKYKEIDMFHYVYLNGILLSIEHQPTKASYFLNQLFNYAYFNKKDIKNAIILLESINHNIDINEADFVYTWLRESISLGNIKLVKFLVYRNVNINRIINYAIQQTVIYYARNDKIIELLIKNNANLSHIDAQGNTPLNHAIKNNYSFEAVKILIENTKNINSTDINGNNALCNAIYYGYNFDIIKLLIDKSTDLSYEVAQSIPPLLEALRHKDGKDIVKLFIDKKANLNCTFEYEEDININLLEYAVLVGSDIEIIKILIEYGLVSERNLLNLAVLSRSDNSPEILEFFITTLPDTEKSKINHYNLLIKEKREINQLNNKGNTKLHEAVLKNNLSSIEKLFSIGAKLDINDKNGYTPIHIAAKYEKIDAIKLLFSIGWGNPNILSKQGLAPIHIAAKYGKAEAVQVLINNGADYNPKSEKGFTPLHIAAKYGYTDIIEILTNYLKDYYLHLKDYYLRLKISPYLESWDHNVDLYYKEEYNFCSKKGFTPLHIASKHGNNEAIKILIANGADCNIKSQNGFTPLRIATKYGNNEAIKILIDNGADCNIKSQNGSTPIHIAARHNNAEIIDLLVNNNVDINSLNDKNKRPLKIAKFHNNQKAIEKIKFIINDVNKLDDRNGHALIHKAVLEDNHLEIEKLLRRGSNINLKCRMGLTPLHHAALSGKYECAEILIRRGANVNETDFALATPLHHAITIGNTKIIKILVAKHNLNINQQDYLGYTPLDHAYIVKKNTLNHLTMVKQNKIINYLKDHGAVESEIANKSSSDNQMNNSGNIIKERAKKTCQSLTISTL